MLTIASKHRVLRRPTPLRAGAGYVRPCEEGFLLVEVMISTMLVALIVVATLTGFDVANRATTEERRHAQAVALAAQSQEQLRSDSAAALSELETSPRKYTRAVNGTTYTITQEAKPINSGATSTGCGAGETSAQTGLSILISSVITWSKQKATARAAVREASVIAPPTGSTLEVDVQNGRSPVAGVSGVTVLATYFPSESKTANTLSATTGAAGCVVFTALPTTKVTVEIQQRSGFVTTSGLLKYPTKENIALAPNVTTHYGPVVYNEGGRVTGEFSWKGKTGEVVAYGRQETVTGDTFVAYNSELPPEPYFEVGSSSFKYESGGEEPYKALTGSYAVTATTPAAALYPRGDLFPFSGKWQVYGGDCLKDNIETVTAGTEKLLPEGAKVEPGMPTVVKVPLSYVRVTAKKGVIGDPGGADGSEYPITITNRECTSEKTPNNASAPNLVHTQKTNAEGHLEHPFQPYGKYELCVYNATLKDRYVWNYNNTTAAGSTLTVFPSEKTKAQWEAQEATNKTEWEKQEKEEKLKKKQREEKETLEKADRSTTEAKRKEGEEKKEPYYTIESGQSSC